METLSLQAAYGPPVEGEPELFAGLLLPRYNWTPGMGASLALHVLAVAGLLAMQQILPLLSPETLDMRYALQTLPLRAPQRLYYQVDPQPPRPAPKGANPRTPAAPRRASVSISPGIEIPALPQPPRLDSILIQPSRDLATLLAPLPVLSAWTQPVGPPPKAFVQPGRTARVTGRTVLDAPPSLDRPNRELRLSDLRLAGPPALAPPALPRPAASTAPVRVIEPPSPSNQPVGAGIGLKEGDFASLITAGPAILPPNSYVTVPAGVAAPVSGGNSAEAAAGAGGSGPAGKAAASPENPIAARRTDPPLPPGSTRVAKPKEGQFTFMVMGSKPEESFPEAAGILSGKLVYTVYLGIGLRPDWILQYCLPKSAPQSGGLLAAPYPYLMFRPRLSFDWDDDYLFVHGMVGTDGKFEQLALVGGYAGGDKAALLDSLLNWEFRPATRGGKPTPVEVLLIIPRPER